MQVAGVHDSARYTSHVLMATDDACIPGYRRVAEACHAEGCVVLSQIFHPGREIMESADGLLAVAYSASASPNERFRVMPRELDQPLIDEIVAGYAAAARRLHEAGLDGVEVVASHGYLPAQFLNPRVNRRKDGYNGDLDARLRFLREVLAAVRAATSEDFIVGLRLSADERDPEGLSESESLQAAEAVQGEPGLPAHRRRHFGLLGGAIHIVPPMAIEPAYLAREAGTFKARLAIPLFVTGRINQPQEAEAILARGQADVCGMTRALICDPQMPNKAEAGRSNDVRACIACNQACIGHFHRGYPISCIQHPETGREPDLRNAQSGLAAQARAGRRRRPGGDEGGGGGGTARPRGSALRGRRPARRPGQPGATAAAPRGIRRRLHQPATGDATGRRRGTPQHAGRPRAGGARTAGPGDRRYRRRTLLAAFRARRRSCRWWMPGRCCAARCGSVVRCWSPTGGATGSAPVSRKSLYARATRCAWR